MPPFRYPAYRTFQVKGGKALVLFAAPAVEIGRWAGVPQRMRLEEGPETIGFQREKRDDRVREIAAFFENPNNVVQNPLLAAQQHSAQVRFEPTDPSDPTAAFGEIVIDCPDLENLNMLDLMRRFAQHLESRIDDAEKLNPGDDRIADLAKAERERYGHRRVVDLAEQDETNGEDEAFDSDSAEFDAQNDQDAGANWDAATLLSENTSIREFYTEVLARIAVLERSGMSAPPDEFLGFYKDAIMAYLLPVVLVDGQHRLRGAVLAAESEAQNESSREDTLDFLSSGMPPAQVDAELIRQHSRSLPISMLMDPSPSEHVFQFVVVNQKATPLSAALLGTIVSTSLEDHEVDRIGERLRAAKIKFDDSRAISYLTRKEDSPFFGLVQTGINSNDKSELLQWTVLQGLVKIFRDLSGGRFYGLPNDYAALWAKKCLASSKYVEEAPTLKEKQLLWSAPDGPWREVFIRFFTLVRDGFSDTDPAAENIWGNPKQSNLFNKVSLTILAADFFKSLHVRRRTLDSADDVDDAFTDWMDPNRGRRYFARPWDFGGHRKDAPAVRRRLAILWSQFSENPDSLPPLNAFKF